MLSNQEFSDYDGKLDVPKTNVGAPLSLSSGTTGSIAARTSWRSNEGGGIPSAYSKRTRQTTLSWDDNTSGPSLPESDRGAKFLKG